MILETFLRVLSHSLLEVMFAVLLAGLLIRYLTYRASRYDQIYFATFTREIERKLQEDDLNGTEIDNVDDYINQLMDDVSARLPSRSVRFGGGKGAQKAKRTKKANVVSLREYVGGNQSLIHSIQSEINVFKSAQAPSFKELTSRIMNRDEHWVKIFGILPIDSISRVIDILPGIFIVIGIFGTFVGISQALPQLALVDFNNIEASSGTLSEFVKQVTFAMKTSIAGIICSLILSFLNALSPIQVVRQEISTKLKNSLEHIWFFIQGDVARKKKAGFNHEVLEILQNINQNLEERGVSAPRRAEKTETKVRPLRASKPKPKRKTKVTKVASKAKASEKSKRPTTRPRLATKTKAS